MMVLRMSPPKARNGGSSTPVPVSETSNEPSLVPLPMCSPAERAPVAVGVNLTVKVVLAPAANEAGKALAVKSLGLAPSFVIPVSVSRMLPLFVTTKVFTAPAVLPRSIVELPSVSGVPAGCWTPICCTAPLPLSVVAWLTAPALAAVMAVGPYDCTAVGANWTAIVWAARVPPAGCDWFGTVRVTLVPNDPPFVLIVNPLPPGRVSVTSASRLLPDTV
jgi:hypothetical protein